MEEKVTVLTATITPHKVEKVGEVYLDPPITIFNVVLENQGGGTRGVWCETWGTRGELHAFLRGVRAGCEMSEKRFQEPELPWEARQA